jgi:hypothetical protein
VAGRRTLSARYWSEASKERVDPPGVFYFWKGERPRHPDAPQLGGIGEINLEDLDRAHGYFTTRSDGPDPFHTRTSGIYLRADPGDAAELNGNDAAERAALIEGRLDEWRSTNASAASLVDPGNRGRSGAGGPPTRAELFPQDEHAHQHRETDAGDDSGGDGVP